MIVIAETNFIFELVLRQEEAPACNELLDLCHRRQVTLILPAFSIIEAGIALERRQGERRAFLREELDRQLKDASRSDVLTQYAESLSTLKKQLVVAEKEEADNWTRFRTRERSVRLIDMSAAVLTDAVVLEFQGMRTPDAIVLASVITYLRKLRKRDHATPAIFVSRDKGFLEAKPDLEKLNCRIVVSFRDAAEIVRRSIEP